jgi:hypothetical protein
MDRQRLARHAGSPGGSPSGYLTSRFSTSAINPHPSTSQTQASKSTGVRLLQVVAGTYPPHIHLARLTPNQHTLTCRYINDLVLKQPAYPQTGNILRAAPFLPPIEQVYLELCFTTECKAETLFHNSFITKVHLLSPQHIRTRGRHTRGQCPFRHLEWMNTQGLTPVAPHTVLQLSPFSFPSCGRKGALFARILTVFARGVTKRVH